MVRHRYLTFTSTTVDEPTAPVIERSRPTTTLKGRGSENTLPSWTMPMPVPAPSLPNPIVDVCGYGRGIAPNVAEALTEVNNPLKTEGLGHTSLSSKLIADAVADAFRPMPAAGPTAITRMK